jgi:hypothetical protein
MKILVVSEKPVEILFSGLSKTHDLVLCKPEDALINLVTEEPNVIFCFAEYQGNGFENARKAFDDMKRSLPSNTKLFRLGFLPEDARTDETYLRLPISPRDIESSLDSF